MMWHLSGAFTAILDVHRMLAGFRDRLQGACFGSPPGVQVDSSVCVFAITSHHSFDPALF
jgi:hypothetical protein